MQSFDFHTATRIVFGGHRVDELGDWACQCGGTRALVVSDPGVVAAGHTARGIESLRSAGVDSLLFDALHENPSTDDVDRGVQMARDFQPDLLVGLGGGSSMDCAKGINFLYTNGGRMRDYWGEGRATREMLPMIAVPTTAGTGSEAQSFALISDAQTHAKMACGDKKAACRVALLDPHLTLTQPPRITALTGIDALAHAVETYVTKRRNPISVAFSREAWRLLVSNFLGVLQDPLDVEARAGMQLGACFAGMAIENSMLGSAHALANPMTASFGIPHGQAVGLMLPHVVRFNGQRCGQWYVELLQAVAAVPGVPATSAGAEGLAEFLVRILRAARLADRLSQLEVPVDRFAELAEDAAKQWTGTFNPVPMTASDFERLYRDAI